MDQENHIVIIGCGAGGGTAAQFVRKTDRKTKVTIFEQGSYTQYSKCGLPYTISNIIPKVDDLIEFSEEWFKKNNINVLLNTKVEKIDIKNKTILAKKENKTIKQQYNKLIIATGAKPFIPPIKNLYKNDEFIDGIYTVRTIDDIKMIIKSASKAKNAVIIGAGLIGLEMADNLYKKGIKVSIVETLPNILANNLDDDMARIVADHIPREIDVFTNYLAINIESIDGKINCINIKNNNSGQLIKIDTDLLILTVGTQPNVDLAKQAGCKIGNTGGIIVNDKSETSIKDVYAIGDCTEYIDFVTAKPCLIGLGSIAVRQGIAAGINSAGGEYILPKGVLFTSTSKFFEIEIASVGPALKNIDGFSIVQAKFNGRSLLDYFPGGKPISIKVLVDEYTGMIMAAQAVGDNAAQRINTFACAILGELDIETFRKLETAYAPPVAPTLDAITLVCDIVSKKLKNKL